MIFLHLKSPWLKVTEYVQQKMKMRTKLVNKLVWRKDLILAMKILKSFWDDFEVKLKSNFL